MTRLANSHYFIVKFSAAIGLALVIIGIMTCLKSLAAVRIGTILSYLALVVFPLGLVMFIGIIQAHCVLHCAKKIRKMGVPLTVKP